MPVIGIDLGTTNTVVGAVRRGEATTLHDADGQPLIPSVVSFHPNGQVLVGHAAKERRLNDARNTVYSIKRLIGRSWSSQEVERARTRFPFEMREGPGQAALVVARGETFTLPEISAFVLRHAKALAERALGSSVDRAVVTVPANFNDLQRAATKVAGRVAGLEVMRILNEPTAAALAYGYGKAASERIVIYDFGGGTFDVTLLDLSGNVFEVLATAGNTFLGGDDIDLAVAQRIAEVCLQQHRFDPRSDPQAFERVRIAAERVKIGLSNRGSHTERIVELTYGARGRALDLDFTMTRPELDEIASPIVDQTFEVCEEALGIARLGADDFDEVVLVGGSTRLGLVRKRVEEFFLREPLDRVNPDEVVAIGAAIQANALTGAERRRSVIPNPPMPAARASGSESGRALQAQQKSRPPPLPARKTNPFGRQEAEGQRRAPVPTKLGVGGGQPPAQRTPQRRRVTTGMGLGPAPKPPPLPQRKSGALDGQMPGSRAQAGGGTKPSETRGDAKRPPPVEHPPDLPLYGVDDDEVTSVSDDLTLEADLTAGADSAAEAELPTEPNLIPPPEPTGGKKSALRQSGVGMPAPPPRTARPLAPMTSETEPADGLANVELDTHDSLQRIAAEPPPAAPDRPRDTEAQWGAAPAALAGPALTDAVTGGREAPASGAQPPGPAMAPAATPVTRLSGDASEPVAQPALPLLVDVTPLSLCVETVGGYCDKIIERNTPVPCEQSRTFVTASDNQTSVSVRVGQGESAHFGENTLLGELELGGLPKAPRGQAQVVVTFGLDTDGILNVSARDAATGNEQKTRIRLVGLPEREDIDAMAARQAARQVG